MLDDRKTAILRAVVEEYIATAQPVGSSHIAASDGVQVSSATVRNDMAFLEQEGYLAQPHTSAGRIPTDKGYRFFVDHLTPNGKLGVADQIKVGEQVVANETEVKIVKNKVADDGPGGSNDPKPDPKDK